MELIRQKDMEERKQNKILYYKLKEEGKFDNLDNHYVAISKMGLIGSSKDPNEITKYVLHDTSVFTTRVGGEDDPYVRTVEILVIN